MSERAFRLVPWMALTITLLFAVPVTAQRITGQIRGKISDPSLASLGGVTVELTSDNIIGTRTVVTTSRGRYRFITLPPGFYDLRFRHPGFETTAFRHVPVAVGTTTHRDLILQVASMTDIVDVHAESAAADLSSSEARLGRLSARKRAESREEAPISIAVFDATAIENRSMGDLSDLADFTPNFEFATTSSSGGTSNAATVYIRGVGQADTSLWFDPGVGIYLDGVYLARAQGAVLGLVDVESVEVLRGPQGTLFGKGTMGGAISVVTRRPHRELTGHLELSAGNFDRLDGSARVNGGLSRSFFGSLSMASTHASGFTRSFATGEDYSDDNTDSARLALRWQASPSVTVDWTGDASRQRERGADTILTGFPNGHGPLLDFYNTALTLTGRQPYDERWFTGTLRGSYSTSPGFAQSDIVGTSLDVHGMLSANLSLRSITSYRQLDLSESKDGDGSPNDVVRLSSEADQWQGSQEIWLSGLAASGRLTWLLGAFYFEEQSRERSSAPVFGDLFEALEALPGPVLSPPGLPSFLCGPGPPPPGLPCYGGAGNPLNLVWSDLDQVLSREPATRSYSVFSEGTFDLSDRLSATAGLRSTHEEKEFFQEDTSVGAFTNLPPQVFIKDSWSSVTARFNLAFQATPVTLLYWRASNGFKSGGFSASGAGNQAFGASNPYNLSPFDPEKVWSQEAGIKTEVFAHRLHIYASLFWNRHTDLQLNTIFVSDDRIPFTAIDNAGKAEVKGFDIGLRARLSRSFRIDAGAGHIEAEYTGLGESVQGPTLDGRLPWTPEWNLVVSPEYVVHLQGGGAVVLHADYTYKTKLFNDAANRVTQDAYGVVNLRASFIVPSGRWEAYAYGTNLRDREYQENGFFSGEVLGPTLAVAGRPREWGIGLKYRF